MPIDFIEDEAQAPAIDFEPDVEEELQPQPEPQPEAQPEPQKSRIPEFLLPQRRLPTLTPEQIAAQEKPLVDLPMWAYRSIPLAGVAPNVAEGLARATKANIEGLTSPAGIATTVAAVAAPEIAGPVIAAQMIPSIYQSGKEALSALTSGDIAKLTESLTNLGVGGTMAVAGGAAPFIRRAPAAQPIVDPIETVRIRTASGEQTFTAPRSAIAKIKARAQAQEREVAPPIDIEATTERIPDAIPKRETEALPVEVPPETRGEVGAQVREQAPAKIQEEAQVQPDVRVAEPEPQWFNKPLSFWRKYTRPVTASKMPEDVRSALIKFTKIEDTPKTISGFLKKRIKEVEEQGMPPVRKIALEQQAAAGWNPDWPFVPADLLNKDFRDAIRKDPSISAEEKAKILSFGPQDEPAPVKPSEEAELRQDLAAEMGEETLTPAEESKPAPPPAEQAPPTEAPTAAAVSKAESTGVAAPAEPPAITKPSISETTQQAETPPELYLSWSPKMGGVIMGESQNPHAAVISWAKGQIESLKQEVKDYRADEKINREAYKLSPNRRVMGGLAPESMRAALAKQRKLEAQSKIDFLRSRIEEHERIIKAIEPPPISIGPGAAAAGEPGKYSAIEQLSDQLRTVPSSAKADPLPWRERMADKLTAGKSALAKVVGRMRAISESVKDAASGMRDINDLERTVGVFDRDTQSSIIESSNLSKVMARTYKNETMRRAAALFIDAGGDQAQLRAALAQLPASMPRWLRKAVETAAELPDDAKPLVDFLRQFYGVREGEAIAHDVFAEGLPDYYTHIWKREPNMPDKLRMALTTGNVNTYWQFARQRKLSTFLEGIVKGKVPELDPAKVIPFYNYTLDRAIASRALIRQLADLKASDGRDVLAPAGSASKVARGSESEATFIKPRAYQGDYRSIDHPALRKWKWAAKDENGNPVFYQADLRVHPEAYERLARMMERSRLTPTPKMKAALRIGSELKAAKFGLASTFHQIHVGMHAAFHWTNPFRVSNKPWINSDKTINASHPLVQDAIQFGHVKLAGEPWEILNMSEGILGSGALIHKIPIVGPWSRVYSEWLFKSYIPKLKLAIYENALERNLKAYEGKFTPEQIKARVGDAVNNAVGELNRLFLGKYGRDPQFQRLLRLAFLAPDFGEARLRFVGKAFTKGGMEERLALGTMFVTLYTAARIGNYLATGDPRWNDWKHLFAIKTKDKYFSMRSVLGDLDHAYDDFRNFAVVRLSPFTRTAQEVIWGKDERGRKRTGSEIVGDVLNQAVPIALQGLTSADRDFLDDFRTAMGLTTRRDNPEMDIHELARTWQAASKDPKVQAQYQRAIRATPLPSEYAKLRSALRKNDRASALKEYRKLRTIKTRTQVLQALQPAKPVTGSWPNERLFVQSLTPRQRQTYRRAMQERRQMYQRFFGLGV